MQYTKIHYKFSNTSLKFYYFSYFSLLPKNFPNPPTQPAPPT